MDPNSLLIWTLGITKDGKVRKLSGWHGYAQFNSKTYSKNWEVFKSLQGLGYLNRTDWNTGDSTFTLTSKGMEFVKTLTMPVPEVKVGDYVVAYWSTKPENMPKVVKGVVTSVTKTNAIVNHFKQRNGSFSDANARVPLVACDVRPLPKNYRTPQERMKAMLGFDLGVSHG